MANRIFSMTGYGRHDVRQGGRKLTVEVRAINNRYLEMFIRTPRWLGTYENAIREAVKEEISRGKIDVLVTCPEGDVPIMNVTLNKKRAADYTRMLKTLRKDLGLSSDVELRDVMQFEDVFCREEDEQLREQYGRDLLNALRSALKDLKASRAREGRNLIKDMRQRITEIRKNLKQIIQVAEKRGPEIHDKIKIRLAALLNGDQRINPDRLEMEVALLMDRLDIAEECVRLESHLKLFLETTRNGDSVGKKLDFVLQEMNREVNTIGSKGNNFDIAGLVVNIKEDVERLREQVRNLV